MGLEHRPSIARMIFSNASPGYQHMLMLAVRVWVLVILLLGTLVSSMGQARSHGLAEMAAVVHTDENGYGHSHEGGDAPGVIADDDAGHFHHNNADHSHEKAHALPQTMIVMAGTMPVWCPLAHPLACGRTTSRLDRPPSA